MQYVLHLTEQCNFRCDYCPQQKGGATMERAVALSVADAAFSYAKKRDERSACLSFYGGEPLMCKDLIKTVIGHCEDVLVRPGFAFRFRLTTNGALLDADFLAYALRHRIAIALSIDGTRRAHDLHRRDVDGGPTFERVVAAASALLRALPDAPAMLTLGPDTAPMLLESVRFLYGLGFRKIVTTLNALADWTERELMALGAQYEALADWYAQLLLRGRRIELPLFDAKFVGHLMPEVDRDKCVPGKHRLSVAVDGSVYPCIQYVNFPGYRLGDAASGPDPHRLQAVQTEALAQIPSCANCALSARCDNRCGCKNLQTTGSVLTVSPVLCAHERMLIPIADALGERIFR